MSELLPRLHLVWPLLVVAVVAEVLGSVEVAVVAEVARWFEVAVAAVVAGTEAAVAATAGAVWGLASVSAW